MTAMGRRPPIPLTHHHQPITTPQPPTKQVSIISLAAEMYVLRRVTEETGGTYAVALDAQHLADLLMAQVAPPPTTVTESQVRVVLGCVCGGGTQCGPGRTIDSYAHPQITRVRCTWTWC